jgi:type II secretory pathway component PulK
MTKLPRQFKFTKLSQQRGLVLILVLMIFAIAAVISGELSYQSHRELRRTSNILFKDEAYLFARGGETFAVQKLLADYAYDKRAGLKIDYLTEVWAMEGEPYALGVADSQDGALVNNDFLNGKEGESTSEDIGEMLIIIEDLHARFNLNNILFSREGRFSGRVQFENLLNIVISGGAQSPFDLLEEAGIEDVPDALVGELGDDPSTDIPTEFIL